MSELAKYRITQPPGWFDGTTLHPVGEEITWKRKDKPSRTFVPLNREGALLQGKDALEAWDNKGAVAAEAAEADVEQIEAEIKAAQDKLAAAKKKAADLKPKK